MSEKDYYLILGVPLTATSREITAAYHLLVRKHHPDTGGGDLASLSRIKSINEAYEVLSDVGKRKEYDRRRRSPRHQPVTARQADASFFPSRVIPVTSAVARSPSAAGPLDIMADVPIAPEEAREGSPCKFTVGVFVTCSHCQGRGGVPASVCGTCGGSGTIRQRRTYQLHIPPGVRSGTVIRLAGHGKAGPNATGDLVIRVTIQPCW